MSLFLLLETICASMALAMSLLAICMLALRADPNGIYKPLILFFSANAYIEATSVIAPLPEFGYFKDFYQIAEIISIPAFLLLAPALWFYVRGLTSETPARLRRSDIKHFLPFGFAVLACSFLLMSPPNIRNTLIGDGDAPTSAWIIALTLMIIAIMFIWAAQMIIYIAALLRRIAVYRARLKELFASTEGRELRWIVWMIILLVATIFIVIPDMFVGFPEPISFIPSLFDVILIWFLAVWGLRQMPGFILAGETQLPSSDAEDGQEAEHAIEKPQPSAKYEKSALTTADTARIAAKIKTAMQRDALYLDPNLSLRALSKHIGVTPNYVSQTLNGDIGESFFDYVNHWRIERAKPLLSGTDETVLNITYDVGFNSRSSFYKAFKRETRQTPSAYRGAAGRQGGR